MNKRQFDFLIIFLAGHDKESHDRRYSHNKQMHDNNVFYEGTSNRKILNYCEEICRDLQIPFITVSNENSGPTLKDRVTLANTYAKHYSEAFLIDIHSNAGKGRGTEIWTSKGETLSDIAAQKFYENYRDIVGVRGEFKFRPDYTDGDVDKEKDFYTLRYSNMAAILLEFLFFDVESQALLLLDDEVLRKFAHVIVLTILDIYNYMIENNYI